jgi:hypothetical protein
LEGFWGLTCDFWAENDKKKCNGNKSVSSLRAVAAVRLGVGKRHSKAERQRSMRRLRDKKSKGAEADWVFRIPPIAKCAMDGAPGDGCRDGRAGDGK